jgi:hypothetical protein
MCSYIILFSSKERIFKKQSTINGLKDGAKTKEKVAY